MSCFKRIRRGKEDRFYTVKWEWHGRQYTKLSPATTRADAEKYLEKIKLAHQKQEWAILQSVGIDAGTTAAPSTPVATIADLLTTYETHALDIKETTRKQNAQALRQILAQTLEADSPLSPLIAAQPLTILDATLVHRWKTLIDRTARLEAEHAGEHRAHQLKGSANSRLRQARSLFTRQLRALYPRVHLELPASIDSFLKAPGFKSVTKKKYNPPSDAILAKTFADLTRLTCIARGLARPLPRDPSPPVARRIACAVWLTIAFGLRKSEIAEARHEWIITRDGRTCIAGDKITKNKDALDILCPFPNALPQLAALGIGAGQGHILEGTPTDRHEETFRDIAHWMRRLGWQTEKCIHEFRAWCGCQVAISTGSLIAAQHFMRHASHSTTERNYGRYIRATAHTITLNIPKPTELRIHA